MINKLINKKKYFLRLLGIFVIYFILVLIIWEKIPDEIFLPLRFDIFRKVGFYPKNIGNIAFVFITPIVGILGTQMAVMWTFNEESDLFAALVSSKLIDLVGYLLAIFGPLAFLVCSFTNNGFFSYYFYFLGLLILIIKFLAFKFKYQKMMEK